MSVQSGARLGPSNDNRQKQKSFENEFIEHRGPAVDNHEPASDQKPGPQQDEEQLNEEQGVDNTKENKIKSNPRSKDKEEKRIKKLSKSIEKLNVSILEMKEKYKDLDMEEIMFKKRSPKKEEEIKKFLSEKKKEKADRKRKKKLILQRQSKSMQQSLNLQQEIKKISKSKVIQASLQKYKRIKELREKQKNLEAEKSKQINEMYEKIHSEEKKKPKFFIRKMQEDRQMHQQQIQSERQFLFKRKQNYKPIDVQQLQNHSKRHQELLEQLQSLKKAEKQQQYLRIVENNKKLQEFYRGQAYDKIVEQQSEKKLKRKDPHQRYKKVKNYQEYVRENFIPKTQSRSIQQDNRQEQFLPNQSSMSHREVRRYRYLQGVSYGEVVEHRPAAKTEAEQKKLGVDYLAYMKSLPKRREDKSRVVQDLQNSQMYLIKPPKKPNPLAERSGRKSLEVKISSKPTRDQLEMALERLKVKDKQMSMREKVLNYGQAPDRALSRQVNEQIIDNIQRKLNLLSKLEPK